MFRSLTVSILVVALAAAGVAALPIFPQSETASVTLDSVEVENARTLLGENPAGPRPPKRPVAQSETGDTTLTLSIPRLGLQDIPVPTASSQVELDREGIIHLKETGVPWQEGSNTFIVGHALGFLQTRIPYVFYELGQMQPGDEILVNDASGRQYTYRVYDLLTVRPADYWVTYPVNGKTVISLQTCVPIPTFEKRLIVRGELVEG
jgi:sortase A